MAQLEVVLGDLETIVNQLREAGKAQEDQRRRLVISGRQRLAERMRDLVEVTASDARLTSNPELARQFAARITEWRHTISQYQARWRAMETTHDSSDYAASVASLRESNAVFLSWARGALARA